ncbi:hypothetical protein ELOC111193_05110 [Elizabethkingia occulta]|uniref:Peptidase A2 domain-containing protein n=1 Tax=Elizabethkingia occulta TaxID=1867263 RepID=A0A1T3MMD8_9FLAO|nr:hypothetical protein [Elizabethkingia occulta]OPB96559.1 hypothetical protein BB020_15955 [Elizabethkingia occulta]OPC65832.1 hypothetical protein BAZ10_00920 [Elizabethkingia occulta]
MKHFFSVSLLFVMVLCFSQQKLTVVKANSNKAKIYEEDNMTSGWGINPKVKPDIHTTGRITKCKKVVFKTDIDSIVVNLKSGEKKDFIVLLNGKDSCYTRIQAPEVKNFSKTKPEIHDTIPFIVNKYNTNLVKTFFNHKDSLTFNFDTGATEMSVTRDALKNRIKSNPQLYSTQYDIQIGKRTYKSEIYDHEMVGQEADGLLGWNIFDGMLVELNYDKEKMIVHSKMPKSILKDKGYSKFKIWYFNNKPFIECDMWENGVWYKEWFLFDLGYQRSVMLDNDLLKEKNFPVENMKIIKKTSLRGVSGKEIPVITANLQKIKIGKAELKNIPAQLLTANKPMGSAKIHILGNDMLKRFNTVLDFQNNIIYLKPNTLFSKELMN